MKTTKLSLILDSPVDDSVPMSPMILYHLKLAMFDALIKLCSASMQEMKIKITSVNEVSIR